MVQKDESRIVSSTAVEMHGSLHVRRLTKSVVDIDRKIPILPKSTVYNGGEMSLATMSITIN